MFLDPVASWHLIHRMAQARINVRIHLAGQIRRRMFQQLLCHCGGYTVWGKHRTKGLAQIMKLEITQTKLFTYLGPSILAETAVEYLLLFRIEVTKEKIYHSLSVFVSLWQIEKKTRNCVNPCESVSEKGPPKTASLLFGQQPSYIHRTRGRRKKEARRVGCGQNSSSP